MHSHSQLLHSPSRLLLHLPPTESAAPLSPSLLAVCATLLCTHTSALDVMDTASSFVRAFYLQPPGRSVPGRQPCRHRPVILTSLSGLATSVARDRDLHSTTVRLPILCRNVADAFSCYAHVRVSTRRRLDAIPVSTPYRSFLAHSLSDVSVPRPQARRFSCAQLPSARDHGKAPDIAIEM